MDEGARIDTKKVQLEIIDPTSSFFQKPTKNIDTNYSALLLRQTAGMSFCTGLDKEGERRMRAEDKEFTSVAKRRR